MILPGSSEINMPPRPSCWQNLVSCSVGLRFLLYCWLLVRYGYQLLEATHNLWFVAPFFHLFKVTNAGWHCSHILNLFSASLICYIPLTNTRWRNFFALSYIFKFLKLLDLTYTDNP